MTLPTAAAIHAACTKHLTGHSPRSLSTLLRELAESSLAELPTDMYGQGGVVADLEREMATRLGKQAAVMMPSGTMAQQIALRAWCDMAGAPRFLVHASSHLMLHEQFAHRHLHGLCDVPLGSPHRAQNVDDVRSSLQSARDPIAAMLFELPLRELGGVLPDWLEVRASCEEAHAYGLRVHLDGARLWECVPFYQMPLADICAPFDSVYVSFYKILGGLPGAMLAGPTSLIDAARGWLRRHGGNLQQQAPAAIAAKLGLVRHEPKMVEYVGKARELAEVFRAFPMFRVTPDEVRTNMFHAYWLPTDRGPDELTRAALHYANETKTWLFRGVAPSGRIELTCGDGSLAFSRADMREALEGLLRTLDALPPTST